MIFALGVKKNTSQSNHEHRENAVSADFKYYTVAILKKCMKIEETHDTEEP